MPAQGLGNHSSCYSLYFPLPTREEPVLSVVEGGQGEGREKSLSFVFPLIFTFSPQGRRNLEARHCLGIFSRSQLFVMDVCRARFSFILHHNHQEGPNTEARENDGAH